MGRNFSRIFYGKRVKKYLLPICIQERNRKESAGKKTS